MQTMDIKTKWLPISLAARTVERTTRQIYRYIKAGHVSVASFSGTNLMFVDMDELRAFLDEKVQCKGCSIKFSREGKKQYHSVQCWERHYAKKREGKRHVKRSEN